MNRLCRVSDKEYRLLQFFYWNDPDSRPSEGVGAVLETMDGRVVIEWDATMVQFVADRGGADG